MPLAPASARRSRTPLSMSTTMGKYPASAGAAAVAQMTGEAAVWTTTHPAPTAASAAVTARATGHGTTTATGAVTSTFGGEMTGMTTGRGAAAGAGTGKETTATTGRRRAAQSVAAGAAEAATAAIATAAGVTAAVRSPGPAPTALPATAAGSARAHTARRTARPTSNSVLPQVGTRPDVPRRVRVRPRLPPPPACFGDAPPPTRNPRAPLRTSPRRFACRHSSAPVSRNPRPPRPALPRSLALALQRAAAPGGGGIAGWSRSTRKGWATAASRNSSRSGARGAATAHRRSAPRRLAAATGCGSRSTPRPCTSGCVCVQGHKPARLPPPPRPTQALPFGGRCARHCPHC